MRLDEEQLSAAKTALLAEGSDNLIAFMADKSISVDTSTDTIEIKRQAAELGWIDPVTGAQTTLGFLVSDSCREYSFWRDRDRELPFENALPHLSRSVFEGKFVCEVGSGMGANLMSLVNSSGKLCGVEPVEVYAQLGDILRQRDGISPIETRLGGAEALPFEGHALDMVLLVTAHQYFDIKVALREIARVLRPGGELILIGAALTGYLNSTSRDVFTGKGDLKDYTITILNTLSYMALGRRTIGSRSGFSTSRPVYPTRASMMRWLRAAGFEPLAQPDKIGNETCYYMKRID